MISPFKRGAVPGTSRGGLSFIGPDVIITGNVAAPSDLHVDGRIEGDIRCGTLVLGESGIVIGNIVADEARLAGLVEGTINARRLNLSGTARATGDVRYEAITIEVGAQVAGRFTHGEEKLIEAPPVPKLIAASD
jgi:cytoskeletal protein CcmA (bactofilin family)